MKFVVYALLSGIGLSTVIAPFALRLLRSIRASQPIYSYVGQHENKKGTPTMGGIVFIVPLLILYAAFGLYEYASANIFVLSVSAYAVIGFLDDFIKVRFNDNRGLRPYQKIIGQLLVAIGVSFLAYYSRSVGSSVYIPVADIYVDLGWWYVPFTVLVYVAATNAVNLTDGLDGLSASSSTAYLGIFEIIILIAYIRAEEYGDVIWASEYTGLAMVTAILIGALSVFLVLNTNKALVFMGDTGSLALGAAVASVGVATRMSVLIPVVGAVFVWSALSVILQVAVYKSTKKRIFLMAPFHHHLELKGFSEAKISFLYALITVVSGLIAILII